MALMLVFNILIQFFTVFKANAQTLQYTACYPDPVTGTVKFIVKYDDGGTNPSNAYVVANFNNWSYDPSCMLTWQQDPSDGVYKMMGTVSLAPGTYEYKFRVHYGTGTNGTDDPWVDPTGTNGANGVFTLDALTKGMKVISSRNQVAPGESAALAADLYKDDGTIEALSPSYSIEPAVSGASIGTDGILKTDTTVQAGTSINVKASTADGKTAVKTINVIAEDPLASQNTVQYFRYDSSSYDGWNVWAWGSDSGAGFNFSEDTDFGKLAGIGSNTSFLMRRSASGNDWAEQTGDMSVLSGAKEVYVIENDSKVYTDFREAVNAAKPKVITAIMDSKNQITAYLTNAPRAGTSFDVYMDGNKIEGSVSALNDKKVTITLPDNFNLDPSKLLEVKPSMMFNSCTVTMRKVLDSYYYTGNDLGATYTSTGIDLKLWAPTADSVNVMTYSNYSDSQESGTAVPMTKDAATGVWSVSLDRSSNYGKYFMYKLNFYSGTSSDKTTYAVDPYATAVGLNGDKGALISMDDQGTIPEKWNPMEKPALVNQEDSIIYEMHMRDFTIDPDSGVDENYRGKFLGAAQTGTVYTAPDGTKDTSVKTGIDHLKELGVTHVHLIPVYDFGSVDESNTTDPTNRNWGYDPKNYNAVEGSYSTNPSDPTVRIKEYRQMIQGMHDAGIRVIMDVVYNHMQSTTNMDNIVQGYYFRSDDMGRYTNGSGCGNEVASERPMVHKFIIDSSKQWATNYNIDGLRFDLMALVDKDTIKDATNSIKSINPTNIVYGEPWTGGSTALSSDKQTVDGTQKNNQFGMFNDTFRDALRGGNSPGQGYVNGAANSDTTGKVEEGLKGSINSLTADPEETINYAEVHDNYCLWDQITKTLGQAPDQYLSGLDANDPLSDEIVKRDILTQGILMTSQGIPLTQAGGEFLRTKKGDGNSYKSSDDINEIDWKNKKDFNEVFDYNKGLIQLRKEHPAFRMTNAADIQNNLDVWAAAYNSNVILTHLKNHANGDKWTNIVVIYNPTGSEYNLNDGATGFPEPAGGQWHMVVNDTQAGVTDIGSAFSGKPAVKPYSMMVLYDQEQEVKTLDWSYLFSDQSKDYTEPMEPIADDDVKVRFRAKAGNVTDAYVHYYDMASPLSGDQKIAMTKITDDSFYTSNGYDKLKVEFWEGVIPKGSSVKFYDFEVKNGDATAWISGGTNSSGDNKGVTSYQPASSVGTDYGFRIVPGYKTADWSKESIIYQIMVDRFRNGDTSNDRTVLDPSVSNDPFDFTKPSEIMNWNDVPKAGYESDGIWNNDFFNGDLEGVQQALPYLKNQLGVTGVYLMPVFQSQSNHKYDTEDYEYADKNFGGNKGLQSLVSGAHNSGINVILDGVFNHTSSSNERFKDAYSNVNSQYRDNYFFGSGDGYLSQGYYGWNGVASLPKLNYGSADVQNYIYSGDNSIVKKYLKQPYGIDGWRMDAGDDVSKSPSGYSSGSETQKNENLEVWEGMNTAIRSTNPNAYILGEYWGNDSQWFDGKHWDGKMNYSGFLLPFVQNRNANSWLGSQSLDNNGGESVADIGKFTRNQLKTLPYQAALNSTNSISTHDRPRFLDWDYTGKGNKAMMELAATLQMTYIGVPMIYYGDEIGTASQASRTDKSSLDQGNDPYNRGTFDWNISDWDMDMFNDYRNLIETRKDHKNALVYGAFEEVVSHKDNKYIVYARYGNNDRSLVVLNNSGENSSKLITVNDVYRYGFKDGDVLRDVMTGNTVKVSDGTVAINSKDMSASVYVLDDPASNLQPVTQPALDTTVKDSRTQLGEVKNVKYAVSNTESGVKADVAWDSYTDTNAKDILVRVYDSSNVVCGEKRIALSEKLCTFDNLPQGNYKVAVRAEADRSKTDSAGVDDQYADSIYTIAAAVSDVTPDVKGVTLDKTTASVQTGETFQLTAQIDPVDAYDKTVVWSSDNTSVANVDENGMVTAAGEGTAVIKVTTNDGNYTAECTVTVKSSYTILLEAAEKAVKAYEDLANGDLSTQALIDAAKAVKEKIDLTGLIVTDAALLKARITAADEKIKEAQKAIHSKMSVKGTSVTEVSKLLQRFCQYQVIAFRKLIIRE